MTAELKNGNVFRMDDIIIDKVENGRSFQHSFSIIN